MRITLFDGEYVIRFAHDVEDKWSTASLHKINKIELDAETTAIQVEETPVVVGEAFCHWKDTFTKKTGRKVALARLLDWMSKNRFLLDKKQRAEIWEKYFQEVKK